LNRKRDPSTTLSKRREQKKPYRESVYEKKKENRTRSHPYWKAEEDYRKTKT